MSVLLTYYFSNTGRVPCYTSEVINSANSVKGKIEDLHFDERSFTPKLQCTGNIMAISSSYGKKFAPGYAPKIKNENRGCRKAEREYAFVKEHDEFKSFRSQIMFTVRRVYANRIKEYKILLFHNGKFTLTGVPTNVDEAIKDVISELINFLQPYFDTTLRIKYYFITMRNYKLTIPGWSLDFFNLYDMLLRQSRDIIVLNYDSLEDFLVLPLFKLASCSPQYVGKWNSSVVVSVFTEYVVLNYLRAHFNKDRNPHQIIRINTQRLMALIAPIKKYYDVFMCIIKFARPHITDRTINKIIRAVVKEFIDRLHDELYYHEENMLRDFVYDAEKYQGFLLKIFSPSKNKLDKTTTITLFSGGKVNFVGVESTYGHIVLNQWLNRFIHAHKDVILYNKDDLLENMSDEEPLYEVGL